MDKLEESQHHSAHLREVLNVMFPPEYIELYHRHPSSVCSLLSIRCWPTGETETLPDNNEYLTYEAKKFGLCPIRRSIYDQCFDELIRQVTVSCIEQGLLLFRVRNELRMTLGYYRKAYESGVRFGMSKAIEAELEMETSQAQVSRLVLAKEGLDIDRHQDHRINQVELKNQLEAIDRIQAYYKEEISKRDQIIEQQRNIIRALSKDCAECIRGS